jgi:hypothetical protein
MNMQNIDVFSFAARFRSCGLGAASQTAWIHALLALTVAGGPGIYSDVATGLACPQVPPFRYFEQSVLRMTARHDQAHHSRGMKRR